MIFAKLSTAKTIPFGQVLDSTGTECTSCTVSDIKICKNNGTPAALNGSATLTHKEVGNYELALTSSDLSEVGNITIQLSKTTYVAAPVHINVLPAVVYDSLVGGTDNLQVDTTQFGGQAVTASATVAVHEHVGTVALSTAQTGDCFTRIGTPVALDGAAASISAMLTKLADDAGGATYDATYDSLNKLKSAIVTGVAATLTATANTETTGTLISGTYDSTYLSNGTYYIVAPTTPAVGGFGLNCNLKFTAGTSQQANSVTIRGYFASGPSRYCNVLAYNYSTGVYDQLSDSVSRLNNASTNQVYTYALLSQHQKPDSGGDGLGSIRIAFQSPSTTSTDRLNIDQCVINVATAGPSASDIANAVWLKTAVLNYDGGVWIDTIGGSAGTSIVDGYGTPQKPSSNYADALVIASTLGVKRFYFKPDSEITLTQSHNYWRFIGKGIIHLGGQSIEDARFEDCELVDGISTGYDADFIRCVIGGTSGITVDSCRLDECLISGNFTTLASGVYSLLACADGDPAGVAAPTFVFAANASVGFRNWRGGLTLDGLAATNNVKVDGMGRLILNNTCLGGDISLRGFWTLTDSTTAGFSGTITDNARYADNKTFAEPSSVPDATASQADKLSWLFALSRNKITQTNTLQTLRNNGDSGDIGTAAITDTGTTFVRDEWQ